MIIIIVKSSFNDIYNNNSKCISFIIKGTVINIENINWIICATFILRSELNQPDPLPTLLKMCIYIIIF